jgi:hypothetical protein
MLSEADSVDSKSAANFGTPLRGAWYAPKMFPGIFQLRVHIRSGQVLNIFWWRGVENVV